MRIRVTPLRVRSAAANGVPAASFALTTGAPASGHAMPSAGSFQQQRALVLGKPVVGGLVEEVGRFGEHEEAVRESRAAPRACAGSPPTARSPTQRPKVGERAAQVDGDVVRPRPRRTRTSFPCGARSGSAGRAARRAREREWLSCTNVASSPASANARAFQLSKKKPRASPKTLGSISSDVRQARSAMTFIGSRRRLAQHRQQVLAVAVLRQRRGRARSTAAASM